MRVLCSKCDLSLFWLCHLIFVLQNTVSVIGVPIFWVWAYLVMVIAERVACTKVEIFELMPRISQSKIVKSWRRIFKDVHTYYYLNCTKTFNCDHSVIFYWRFVFIWQYMIALLEIGQKLFLYLISLLFPMVYRLC